MADPERDFGMAYDEQGYVHILYSTFFDVDPEVDHTAQGYIDRILDTLVDAVEEQLGTVEWHLAPDPNSSVSLTVLALFTSFISVFVANSCRSWSLKLQGLPEAGVC
ncbi:hypothetical protein M5K25_000660 [Dendrobium thyrsiflorum]|uniref:Uncharacterized protein n=1 Tax=Dendrobium thyrsiflorum TaxID=117978 RepID=A0ABD0VV15_DENTH